MYIIINGVRFSQMAILAVAETVAAHWFLLGLIVTVHGGCCRPRAPWLRWVRGWRGHVTIYAGTAMVAEWLWVLMSLMVDSERNAFACKWTQDRLAAWTMVQWICVGGLAVLWTYCARRAVAPAVNMLVSMHATALMGFAMLGMFESGACGTSLFPMLTCVIGMLTGCCYIPWYQGAWTIADYEAGLDGGSRLASDEDRDHIKETQRNVLTCLGVTCLKRQRRRAKRQIKSPETVLIATRYESSSSSGEDSDLEAVRNGPAVMQDADPADDADVAAYITEEQKRTEGAAAVVPLIPFTVTAETVHHTPWNSKGKERVGS